MQFGPEVEPAGPKRVCARLSSREQEWEGEKKVVWRGGGGDRRVDVCNLSWC